MYSCVLVSAGVRAGYLQSTSRSASPKCSMSAPPPKESPAATDSHPPSGRFNCRQQENNIMRHYAADILRSSSSSSSSSLFLFLFIYLLKIYF